MRHSFRLAACAGLWAAAASLAALSAQAAPTRPPPACLRGVDPEASAALATVAVPPNGDCTPGANRGFPLPDPRCTPGAINPTVGLTTLKNPAFRTGCLRDKATSSAQKARTYGWYAIPHPDHNSGQTQTCELDHLISLELGGADTLENIWPQCGPDGVPLNSRFFKQKDTVENYLAAMVRAGKIDIATAQKGIAADWTQFLEDARRWEASRHRARQPRRRPGQAVRVQAWPKVPPAGPEEPPG